MINLTQPTPVGLITALTMAHTITLGTIQGTTHDIILPIVSIFIRHILTLFNLKPMDYHMMIEGWVVEVAMEVTAVMWTWGEVQVVYLGIPMRIQKTSSVINFIFLKMGAIDTKTWCPITLLRTCIIVQRIHLMGKVYLFFLLEIWNILVRNNFVANYENYSISNTS